MMANNRSKIMELSPHLKERLRKSFIAFIGLLIGIIAIIGALLVDLKNDMIMFATIFIGAIFIFFSLWRILRMATQKLCIDEEEIRYRNRFVWKRISWSNVISVGRANDIETKDTNSALKKIKSFLIITNEGLNRYDMSTYSLPHSLEAINQILESRPKVEFEEEEEETSIDNDE